ncbi:hypothetical protein QR680_010260 [Steinernema hermaphroditum]|uniref:Uncharacterized protein n=1 Tax=Steinernema hermaphroditum TaxID=289476 RepID=A0AA39MB92_9BILA|nr:hypothetical protein QR680_010260 [Steinernema hermaphroditum]
MSTLELLLLIIFAFLVTTPKRAFSDSSTNSSKFSVDDTTLRKTNSTVDVVRSTMKEDHTTGIILVIILGFIVFFTINGIIYCSYPRLFRCSYRPPRVKTAPPVNS